MDIQEWINRRQALLAQMAPNSAALFFAAPERTRSRDSDYLFRQNSDFWYFCPLNEPEAALLLIKDAHGTRSVLFNREKDPLAEVWHGRRLGQSAAPAVLAVDQAFAYPALAQELPALLSGLDVLYHAEGEYDYADQAVAQVLTTLRNGFRQGLRAINTQMDWRPLVHEMRLFKSPAEIALMRTAAEISAKAHCRAMEKARAGLFEYHLEGEIQHEFSRHGARFAAYNSIVGSGDNACILHYTENESELRDGDLVLIDAGAEYQGYAGDISRTFPVSGKFSAAQRALYDIVLRAELAAIEVLVPGHSIKQANDLVLRIMVEGLVALGILHGETEQLIAEKAYLPFYMHGLGHWLGLDVHDVGDYSTPARERILQPGMVLTVEPGLYIAPDADVPEAYRGIGIRIEDNLLMVEGGNQVLTAGAPKDPDAIEALMAAARHSVSTH
nr:Xaa-Pro aminopeptidase [Plesiomonas shigelloides]